MKARFKTVIKNTTALACLGIFLYLLYLYRISVPCPVKLATHLDCPGCGISRMLISLTHGDIVNAFYYNQLLIFLLPILILYYIFFEIRFIVTGQKNPGKLENIIFIVIIVLLVLYAVIRNLPFWPFRLPY